MNNLVYALFTEPALADKALGALLDHGAQKEHLTAIFPSDHLSKNSEKTAVEQVTDGVTTTTAADAASGATKGAGAGLVILPGCKLYRSAARNQRNG